MRNLLAIGLVDLDIGCSSIQSICVGYIIQGTIADECGIWAHAYGIVPVLV